MYRRNMQMRSFKALLVALLYVASAQAQSTHSVTLNWNASVDGGAVSVYRAAGACSTNPTSYTQIKAGVATTSYVDTAVPVGTYCYRVTTVVSGAESVPSTNANAPVLPQPPQSLTVQVQ
jgi:hypothetical protein